MPTVQDKDFMAKLKELEAHCIVWVTAYEANYVDVGEPNLHRVKDWIPLLQSLAGDFEATIDVNAVTGSRTSDDRLMIDFLEDNVCGQVDYMEFLETYPYSGRNSELVQPINDIKKVEADLRLLDSTIEWIRDSVDRW